MFGTILVQQKVTTYTFISQLQSFQTFIIKNWLCYSQVNRNTITLKEKPVSYQ